MNRVDGVLAGYFAGAATVMFMLFLMVFVLGRCIAPPGAACI